jgi:hypothetical protein
MATSPYFRHNVRSEQNLYEDLIVESIKFYGQDVYYIPREVVHRDMIFNDEILSRFAFAYKVEMYIQNVEGYDGDGDLFSKFGVEIRDAVTFALSRRRWNREIRSYQTETDTSKYYRPREGDVIHLPMSNSTFEIMSVKDENPFYQLGNLPIFSLRCELFEYSGEDFDTNIGAIDQMEQFGAYQYRLTLDSASNGFQANEIVTQVNNTYTIQGEVVNWNDSDLHLYLAHVGATNDSDYRTFTLTSQITGGDLNSVATPTLIQEMQDIQLGSPGGSSGLVSDFDISAFEFIDFSESNPFGDIS